MPGTSERSGGLTAPEQWTREDRQRAERLEAAGKGVCLPLPDLIETGVWIGVPTR